MWSRKAISVNFLNLFLKALPISSQKVSFLSTDQGHTVGALLEKWRQNFEDNQVSEPVSSVEHILAHVLGTTQISDVYSNINKVVGDKDVEKLEYLCSRRLQNEPVQYVLGEWPFRQLNLKMTPPVFIPWPETEQLIDVVSQEIARKKTDSILDLCCGSGAIALSLLKEHDGLKAIAVDQSEEACSLTKENAERNGLNERIRVIKSKIQLWKNERKFDLVVSNPPYVFKNDIKTYHKMYEDYRALDGGMEGLDMVKSVLEVASNCLEANGRLFLEVEPRHPNLIEDYLSQKKTLGLNLVETFTDFSGKPRYVKLVKK